MKRKAIFTAIMLTTTMIGSVGCMDMKSIFKTKQEKAIAFVEDKYGIEVEPISYEYGKNIFYIYCEIITD